MGVQGLWRVLSPVARPVKADDLEGKRLAIDTSLWLQQILKGYRNESGGLVPNAHLVGLFRRICKLLYYGARPIFVFDGVPSTTFTTPWKPSLTIKNEGTPTLNFLTALAGTSLPPLEAK